jgi:hypothetical protein
VVEHTPLILPTVVVLAVVFAEWRHTRLISWLALAAGFVLLVGAMRYPAASAQEISDFAQANVAVALAFARVVGAVCFLWCVVRTIRSSGVPW